jgi:ABC-2 type transport system permease protein
MKLWALVVKDLKYFFRSFVALFFAFGMPVIFTLIFYFMFSGSINSDESDFQLPKSSVVIVNLDQAPSGFSLSSSELPEMNSQSLEDYGLDFSDIHSMGDLLTQLLEADFFSDIVETSKATDLDMAKAMVDKQKVDMAIIIPSEFTNAIFSENGTTNVTLYHDPTLTMRPAIVRSILNQLLDEFSATKIVFVVTQQQLQEEGLQMSGEQYRVLTQSVNPYSSGEGGSSLLEGNPYDETLTLVYPTSDEEPQNIILVIVAPILSGMLVFSAFYTSFSGMESLLTEDENGTLSRLFTTPTSHTIILAGKTIATMAMVFVQAVVLLLFGHYIFHIEWGIIPSVALAVTGLVILAGATGAFLVAFIKSRRQAGFIMGGLLTLTGMIAMMPSFMGATSGALVTASKFVPQGWTIALFNLAMQRNTVVEMLPAFIVTLVWSLVFGIIGQYKLKKRFG